MGWELWFGGGGEEEGEDGLEEREGGGGWEGKRKRSGEVRKSGIDV